MSLKRTDLACEAVGLHTDSQKDGITQRQYKENGCTVTHVTIDGLKAEKKVGKKSGEYITIEVNDILNADVNKTASVVLKKLKSLVKDRIDYKNLKGKTVLVAGIGNINITPDALGPLTAKRIIATKHAVDSGEEVFCGFNSVAVIATGVMAQTGLEAAKILKGIIENEDIALVIVVDALASSGALRLGKTIQITDAGISPGSGVNNSRKEISKNTLGVPVIALGVPTVCDADISTEDDEKPVKMFITPRDIDEVIEKNAKISALAINSLLQPEFTFEEIEYMIN